MFGFLIVPQARAIVVERLGKFHRIGTTGINFIFPFIERTRQIYYRALTVDVDESTRVLVKRSHLIDLREQVLDFPKQSVITKDNVTMEIDAVLYYQIQHPEKAVYGIVNLVDAIEKVVQTSLRNVVGQLLLDETLASRDEINQQLRIILDETTISWGVHVTRVELQEISPPTEIRERMELQMTAEREKRAEILRAEGKKQAAVLEAEGEAASIIRKAEAEKTSKILEAEGIAEAKLAVAQSDAQEIQFIEEILGKGKASDYLIALKYLSALKDISNGKASKVFLPIETTGILSSIGSIKEMFEKETS